MVVAGVHAERVHGTMTKPPQIYKEFYGGLVLPAITGSALVGLLLQGSSSIAWSGGVESCLSCTMALNTPGSADHTQHGRFSSISLALAYSSFAANSMGLFDPGHLANVNRRWGAPLNI